MTTPDLLAGLAQSRAVGRQVELFGHHLRQGYRPRHILVRHPEFPGVLVMPAQAGLAVGAKGRPDGHEFGNLLRED